MKKNIEKFLKRSERGQAIILIAFAFIGLVAMVGLVTDTGILLIEYGKLKRSVDAAAIAAAQEYRPNGGTTLDLDRLENAAIGMLQLNQVQNVSNVEIHTCEPADLARPVLCNPIGGDAMANRKLVEVTASSDVRFGFLRVIGINSVTLTASSIGEAATIDLVLIMDTSASMAYETGDEVYNDPNNQTYLRSDSDDDPAACNANGYDGYCEPMRVVKNVAWDFVSRLYFPYDRVSVITMTTQTPGDNTRGTVELIPLTDNRTTIQNTIAGVKVFQPRVCDDSNNPYKNGDCLLYNASGGFERQYCEKFFKMWNDGLNSGNIDLQANADPSSCPSSNIGGALIKAAEALQGSGDINKMRVNSFWVVVGLFGGPANATNAEGGFENGFCPQNTWLVVYGQVPANCRDPYPSTRHYREDLPVEYINPVNGDISQISLYDADDYAREEADRLSDLTSGNGVTIYTIGLGAQIQNPAVMCDPSTTNGCVRIPIPGEPPVAENLLQYIAEEAGNAGVNHGQYFFAEDSSELSSIFERIAQNIATKISQ